jgi:alginate O-acetyltransferase complex protein AlgI
MVFSSITFLFYFLPIFLLLYVLLPWRNAVLGLASLLFYTWGEPNNLPLLLICITANYAFGRWIGWAQQAQQSAKFPFVLAIASNLCGLAYYKYYNFAMDSLMQLAAPLGWVVEPTQHVSLPLGISFFIFHAISYLVDIFRRKTAPEKSFIALFTYIIMFPQLVAGPIVRFSSVAKQLHQRRFSWARAELGIRFFILGLAQKILLANTVAITADQIFGLPVSALSSGVAWLGAICYTLQIYFDFGGYSLMAIGLGIVCGFSFPRNFNFPYIAQSVTEFWRRWHISLSRWFRDYVYIPLGGNRGSSARTAFNLFTVFFLCGLWHGANWTFVVWGMLHGVFLVVERIGFASWLARWLRPFRHVYTLLVVVFAWVLFRADSISHAWSFLTSMLGAGNGDKASPLAAFVSPSLLLSLLIGSLLATPFQKIARLVLSRMVPQQMRLKVIENLFLIGLFLLSMISLASGVYNPFIYFRF